MKIHFEDYPEFTPNVSPEDIFKKGSFGGTYWRPIYSRITQKHYKNQYLKYPFLKRIDKNLLTRDWKDYNKNLNKYKVKVGTTLEFWEDKGWITSFNPYGWVAWYCDFWMGKRNKEEDERQIKRWLNTAGPNSRFRKWLINDINRNKKKWNDYSVSPKKRQTLLHWAYELTREDHIKSS